MKKIKFLATAFLIGVLVAIVYYIFEAAVAGGIELVWKDWLNTDENWLVMLPLAIILAFLFFGAQHLFDAESEHKKAGGLGAEPKATPINLVKVLGIGFLSLFAGASLGPEAVLVPASTIVGALVGLRVFKDKQSVNILSIAGFSALFAAFFSSIFAGLLGLFLALHESKAKITTDLLLSATIASLGTVILLRLVNAKSFLSTPVLKWDFEISHVLALGVLVALGFFATHALKFFVDRIDDFENMIDKKSWATKAFAAGFGLFFLYLVGGPLVRYTGNESIEPMLGEVVILGTIGLVWITIVKVAAIAWSKAMGYRGGLIFPMVFVASTMTAVLQQYYDISFIYGLIAVFIGLFVANKKLQILF